MTAVEWLEEKLRIEFGFAFSNNISEQAKEMEKEQIMDAHETELYQYKTEISAQQYYNQTFKSE
jgi:hypothetical protein